MDKTWEDDPNAQEWVETPFGSRNSVRVVGWRKRKPLCIPEFHKGFCKMGALRGKPNDLEPRECWTRMNCTVKTKRVYEKSEENDGFRVLVDRLWPRGLSKEKAKIDLWLREIAPSHELRKWFGHDATRWEEFQKRYRDELKAKPDLLKSLMDTIRKKNTVTLLFAASDEQYNNAVALKDLIKV